ncbi:MAG TPA: hypothetical protein VGH40_01680 [Roseiarcus sp.]|jgi:hypothetical protein
MKKLLAALGLSAALTASAALPLAGVSQAAMSYGVAGADLTHQVAPVEKTQFAYGGYNYCWYPGGWRGPGYYWCGYAWRTGLGWGGPFGWNGWRWRGGYGGWHGGYGWHGGGWHGGGWHGGGWHGGGWHGGGGWRH